MAGTDHVHERGAPIEDSENHYQCQHCDLEGWVLDWENHEKTIASVQAHGLPDHEERLEAVEDAMSTFLELIEQGHKLSVGNMASVAMTAYRTWTKEEE